MSPWAVREVCEIGTLVVRFAHWRPDPHTGITESRSAPAADHRSLRRLVALARPRARESARTHVVAYPYAVLQWCNCPNPRGCLPIRCATMMHLGEMQQIKSGYVPQIRNRPGEAGVD